MPQDFLSWFTIRDVADALGVSTHAVYKVFLRLRGPEWRGFYRKHRGKIIMHPIFADRVTEYIERWNRPRGKEWKTPKQLEEYPGVTAPRIYRWVQEGKVRAKRAGRLLYVHAEDVLRVAAEYERRFDGLEPLREAARRLGVSVTWLREQMRGRTKMGYVGGMRVAYVDPREAENVVKERYRRLSEEEQRRYAMLKGIRTRKRKALLRAKGERRKRLEAEIERLERAIMELERKKGGDRPVTSS